MNRHALEEATARFYNWELRGRGWQRYSYRVPLEPVFVPFAGHRIIPDAILDDARKPSLVSSLFQRLTAPVERDEFAGEIAPGVDPVPREIEADTDLQELEILIPPGERVDPHTMPALLSTLADFGALCFELLARDGRVVLRMAGRADVAPALLSQLRAFLPGAAIREPSDDLLAAWSGVESETCAAVEFGLAREFMIPLREMRPNPDPLTPIIAALAGMPKDAFAVVQVLFEHARAPWAASIERAVTSTDGEPFFIDAPELAECARAKIASPLYAVSLRAMACTADEDEALGTLMGVAGALNQYSSPEHNALVPLACEDAEDLVRDILCRSTHRSGMLMSLDELSGIVRLPSEHLKSTVLLREEMIEKPLPEAALSSEGVVLGEAQHRGESHTVHLPMEPRFSHLHCIGASGTGKSTLLESLILQDITAGQGVGVVDPHGDLVDAVCARIPDERIEDVILFDPADDEGIVGWNILGAHSEIEKELLASDLVSVFRRLSTSWGDQMSVLLANAVLAFLESTKGGTLIELRKFLLDDDYREAFLGTVRDDHVVSFWKEEYPLLIGKKPQAPILTRLDTFLRSRLIRERVTEREKPLNFRQIIDTGKIFLAKLSQGAIGEENAALLGSLIVSKLHQVSLSRQNVAREDRRPFFLYIDEFQHVVVPSMASLFSGLRKYNLSIVAAHQQLYDLHVAAPEVERSLLTNAYMRVAFRVSDEDARKLERSMGEFTAQDLTNLSRGEAICRLGRSEDSFRISTIPLPKVDPDETERRQTRIRRTSAAHWGRPRVRASEAAIRPVEAPHEPQPAPGTRVEPNLAPGPREDPKSEEPGRGRGGSLHKYLQSLITAAAQKHDFKAEIEYSVPDGGRVDVALTRDELRIACEVAGTTTIEQETANIRKCLAAGFAHVCSVSLDLPFLRRLERAVDDVLEPGERERVRFFSPEELLAFIGAQTMTHSAPRVAGYKVEVRHSSNPREADERRRTVAEIMLKSIRRMREKK